MTFFAPKFLRLIFAIYLGLFFTSCSPTQLSIEEARYIQSHTLSVGINSAMDAVVMALQDRLYIIDDVDSELNIIMASRSTEKKLANTVVEVDGNEVPLWLKITGITIVIALIGLLIYSWGDDSDEDTCDQNSHDHCSHAHHHHYSTNNYNSYENDYGVKKIYNYKLNVKLVEQDNGRTQIRIIAQGESIKNGNIVEVGSIQDPNFYARIFNQIDNVIFE